LGLGLSFEPANQVSSYFVLWVGWLILYSISGNAGICRGARCSDKRRRREKGFSQNCSLRPVLPLNLSYILYFLLRYNGLHSSVGCVSDVTILIYIRAPCTCHTNILGKTQNYFPRYVMKSISCS
jgi:hypothetical protein